MDIVEITLGTQPVLYRPADRHYAKLPESYILCKSGSEIVGVKNLRTGHQEGIKWRLMFAPMTEDEDVQTEVCFYSNAQTSNPQLTASQALVSLGMALSAM